jgi:hypothetical protein
MAELLEPKFKEIELNNETLLRIASEGKATSFNEVQKRTSDMTDKSGHIINKAGEIICRDGINLNPDLPTIWMVRRVVKSESVETTMITARPYVFAETSQNITRNKSGSILCQKLCLKTMVHPKNIKISL